MNAHLLQQRIETRSPQLLKAAEDSGREVGVPAIGWAPWGSHFCQFYRDEHDLIETVLPYFRSGLANNELCVWVTCAPRHAEQALEALSVSVPDLESRTAAGQFVTYPHTTWFIHDGAFDPEWIQSKLKERLADARALGFDGLRIAGDAAWLEADGWRDFTEYERTVNTTLRDRQILAMCTYPLSGTNASDLVEVVASHQFVLVKSNEWLLLEPSERKMATEAVEQMNRLLRQRTDALQAALADLQGFTTMVSHDLRNPLCTIALLADALAEHCQSGLDEEGTDMLRRIHRSAARMQTMVVDVLDMAKAENTAPKPCVLDMAALLHDAYEQLTAQASDRRIDLHVSPLPSARGDPTLITQVLANLLTNALKYSRHQPVTRIDVWADSEEEENIYHIRDNGIGFDPADADKLFTVFQRLPNAHGFNGTGVGLATVKKIVTRNGGRVWANGALGHGATFSFTLPVAHPVST